MKKLVFLLILLCVSCYKPPGTVVYEKRGALWQVKEIHLEFERIDQDTVDEGATTLNRVMRD